MAIDVNERVTELTVDGKVVQIGLDTTTNNPASVEDIILGKEAWANGEKIVGKRDLNSYFTEDDVKSILNTTVSNALNTEV